MLYDIRDAALGSGTIHLAVYSLFSTDALLVKVTLADCTEPVELVWAFGGANGMHGRRNGDIGCEVLPVGEFFQLRPEQCNDNTYSLKGNTFMVESPRIHILGIMPEDATLALADAYQWDSVNDLLTMAGQTSPVSPVLLGRKILSPDQPVYLALQRMTDRFTPLTTEQLADTLAANEKERQARATRVSVDTPDPFINAAVSALCLAVDGVWDEPTGTVMHGGVAWRTSLLGWRGPYANDVLGWHERARRHLSYWAEQQVTDPVPDAILPADPTVNLSQNEPSLHSNGALSTSHYDMNLVYIDALFRHLLWTGDLDLAEDLWPVIERHLAWERRLFRRPFGPDGQLPLYEAYAAIWASDDLQYNGGGVTHSSAYNYFHNLMAAKLARWLHKDGTPYEKEADLILKAMHKELWLPDRGWYAEWKDLLGRQQVHPNAGLWTVYHAIDSQAATPFEAWEMTRFVDTQIAHIPIHGPGVPLGGYYTLPTTSWMPYTWSTNNVVMAEVAHTALAFWQAGRADEAFKMYKGCILDSMFLGLCPGNAGMCTYFDMARGETQRDFADAAAMGSRALIEGLFGIHPDLLNETLTLQPGLPEDWDHAALRHPDLDFAFQRTSTTDTYTIKPNFTKGVAVRLRIPIRSDRIESVTINGKSTSWTQNAWQPYVEIRMNRILQYKVVVTWAGSELSQPRGPAVVAKDHALNVTFPSAKVIQVYDPQQALSNVTVTPHSFTARATGRLGHRTAFAKLEQGQMTWYSPVTFAIRPTHEIIAAEEQNSEQLKFSLRNNTTQTIDKDVVIRVGGRDFPQRLTVPAYGQSQPIILTTEGLLPGSNRVKITLDADTHVSGIVTNWTIKLQTPQATLEPVDLGSVLNDKVTQIFQAEYVSPRSPYCSLAIPKQGIGSWCRYDATCDVIDTGLRNVAQKNQDRFLLPQGIPFKTPGNPEDNNILFVSQWDNHPNDLNVPLTGKASHLYLLMAGSTNSMQSRFDNGDVIVTYRDGTSERLALENPTTWWPIDQDYYIDDYAFARPEPVPPRVDLATGRVRLLSPRDFIQKKPTVRGGAANVLDIPLDPDKTLKTLTVRALANEVIIGLMGATLVR